MISSNVIKEALKTSHATCESPEGCIHADGLAANNDAIKEDISSAIVGGMMIGGMEFVPEAIYNNGFHAGYRSAMLEAEEAKKAS